MEVELYRERPKSYSPTRTESKPEIPSDLGIQAPPEEVSPVFQKIEASIEVGNFRHAAHLLRAILMANPSHTLALKNMVSVMKGLGHYDNALKFAKFLYQKNETAENAEKVAELNYLLERDRAALEHYKLVLTHQTQDQELLFNTFKNLGNIYVRSGDFDAAQENYDKAYTISPKSDVLFVNYGTLAIQRCDLDEALARFRMALSLNQDNDKAWVGLALVHRQMGDHRLAWGNLERALDFNPINRTAVRFLMEWSITDSRIAEAIPWVKQYLAHEFEDAETSYQLAKMMVESGNYSEAAVEIERVLALDPTFDEADRLRTALKKELEDRGLIRAAN